VVFRGKNSPEIDSPEIDSPEMDLRLFGVLFWHISSLHGQRSEKDTHVLTLHGMARSALDFARDIAGAQVHDLGLDLAIITFVDAGLASLALAAILEIAGDSTKFTYDRPVKTQYGGDGIRRHGEKFVYSSKCPVHKYEFGKTNVEGTEMTTAMQDLLDAVNLLVPGEEFNAAFIVHYRSTEDGISWHGDHGVGPDTTVGVLAVSIGQSRIFKVRENKKSGIKPLQIHTKHGETLIMYGQNFQKLAMHAVTPLVVRHSNPPQVPGIVGRYGITFRRHSEKEQKVAAKRKRD